MIEDEIIKFWINESCGIFNRYLIDFVENFVGIFTYQMIRLQIRRNSSYPNMILLKVYTYV